MEWQSRYLPPDQNPWRGRDDAPSGACFFHHIQLINLLTNDLETYDKPTFAFIGFKCDEGAQRDLGRTGAVEGPMAIRQRLAKLPLQKKDVKLIDVGNIVCTDHDLEASQRALGDVVAMLLERNIHPVVLGGGHEISYGHFLGIAKHYSAEKRLGIISFDAHFNLHPTEPSNRTSSTTAFYQIAKACEASKRDFDYNCIGIQHASNIGQSFEDAKAFNTKVLLADEMHQNQPEKCADFIDRVADENDLVYLSLSLDIFSPAHAPGVSTIQPLGLNPWHVIPLLRQAAASGKVVCYDISEHVPRYDIDHRTAKLAATLIYEIIHNHVENNNKH